MGARRIVQRRAWADAHPPQFNRENKESAAAAIGKKLRPRLTFRNYMIKHPVRWAELERRARGEDEKPVTTTEEQSS